MQDLTYESIENTYVFCDPEVGLSAGHSFQYTKCKLGLDGSLSYVNYVPFNGGDVSAFYEGSIISHFQRQNLGAARAPC